jgi:GntR family transcriptional regulator
VDVARWAAGWQVPARLTGQPGKPDSELVRDRGTLPLYAQVAEQILAGIRQAGLQAGDRVQSEPELVRLFGISRATAGKALEHLERAGVVRREQGRGTFVQSPRLVQRRPQLGSFSDSVRRSGHDPTHRLLTFEPLTAAADEQLRAWFEDGTELVRIVRLRLVDGKPVGVHRVLVARDHLEQAGIDEQVFADPHASLYGLLDAAGIHIVEGEEHLQAVTAQAAEAAALEVGIGTALMCVLRVSWDAAGLPVEATDARYLGDRFDYSVALDRSVFTGGRARNQTLGEGEEDEPQAHWRGDARRAARDHGGRVREVG